MSKSPENGEILAYCYYRPTCRRADEVTRRISALCRSQPLVFAKFSHRLISGGRDSFTFQKLTCKLLIPYAAAQVSFWHHGPGRGLVWASMLHTPRIVRKPPARRNRKRTQSLRRRGRRASLGPRRSRRMWRRGGAGRGGYFTRRSVFRNVSAGGTLHDRSVGLCRPLFLAPTQVKPPSRISSSKTASRSGPAAARFLHAAGKQTSPASICERE